MDCMAGGERETHVLLVALAVQSHINPMLNLGKRLASKGLHVTLATTEIVRQRMVKANAASASATPNVHSSIRLEFISDGLPDGFDRTNINNVDEMVDQLAIHGPPNLSTLIQSLSDRKGTKFSYIINNHAVPWVADVALDHGIPCATLWMQPSALFAIFHRFFNGLNQFPTVTDPNMPVELPGLPLLRTEDLPSLLLPSSNPSGGPRRTISLLFQNMNKIKCVLVNSFYELEKDVVESMSKIHPIMPVGPLVPPMLLGEGAAADDAGIEMLKAEDSCIEWLDKQRASTVVYVSFGSMLGLSTKQMENIAWGIRNSGRPFLWVVKPPEHVVKDVTGQLPPEFVKETEGRGLVVPWCAQAKVLSHPSVACFLTHCGWNSTLEALTSGVPTIAHPHWIDQPTNAKLLTDVFEVGVRLKVGADGVVEAEEVERCIEEITEGPKAVEMKKKALHWKETARLAVGDGGSSGCNIQLFVDEVVKVATRGE